MPAKNRRKEPRLLGRCRLSKRVGLPKLPESHSCSAGLGGPMPLLGNLPNACIPGGQPGRRANVGSQKGGVANGGGAGCDVSLAHLCINGRGVWGVHRGAAAVVGCAAQRGEACARSSQVLPQNPMPCTLNPLPCTLYHRQLKGARHATFIAICSPQT